MENRKIRAKGNVHVEYQTDKSAGNVFDNMTSTQKLQKNKAMMSKGDLNDNFKC